MSFETIQKNTKQIQCECCYEREADLVIGRVDCNGEPFGMDFCTKCYFGCNPHINSFPFNLYRDPKEESAVCIDCEEYGKYKIEFKSDKRVIYLCKKHFSPK